MAFTKLQREQIHQKFNGHCAYCGEVIKLKDMQIDHIIPQSFFWGFVKSKIHVPDFLKHLTETDVNHNDNLHPACRVCNKWKATFHLELFRSEVSDQLKRLNDYSSNFRMAKKYGLVLEVSKPIVFYFERVGKNILLKPELTDELSHEAQNEAIV
ncbi:MAG TPA: HNH endonuclease domain-containing protein [Cyclobacteriaceae bacterium]|jgi:hypothetical protein|nr:HNH endonuclease domain-containing protein [Cyclobacteriaceae bacterium]